MLSVNFLNLDQCKISLFGKILMFYTHTRIWCCVTQEREMHTFISCFPVGYREISVKIFFDLTLVVPVKIPIFMFLLPRLIACASQPDGNMTSFTLNFSRLT